MVSFFEAESEPAEGVEVSHSSNIHSTAFIGEGVELGDRVTVGPNAIILGPCTVGNDTWIGPSAVIGAPPEISSLPQNRAWEGELNHAGVHIGARVVIREHVVIHQGSHRATTVGDDSWILNRAYLAHDVQTGTHVTISAGVSIGGHCTLGDFVNVGMNVSIHQRRCVGTGAMIGMGTPLTRDVPPFGKAYGSPPRLHGVNSVGMARFGLSDYAAEVISNAYNLGDTLLQNVRASDDLLSSVISSWYAVDPQKPIQ